jgi:hypothetical protein
MRSERLYIGAFAGSYQKLTMQKMWQGYEMGEWGIGELGSWGNGW